MQRRVPGAGAAVHVYRHAAVPGERQQQAQQLRLALLGGRPGSTASRGCRLSHWLSEAHSIHSCTRGSRATEAQLSSSVAEEESSEAKSPSLFTESRRQEPQRIIDHCTWVQWSMILCGSCLRDSVKSDGDLASLLSSSATDEDSCASVALDPLVHEWMLCASDSQWDNLQPLLAVEPGLVSKRDFASPASKQGKAELLGLLLAFARDSGVPVDVNGRSGAGYTPLHLAAMHCHTQVVRTLVSDWEANPEVRDYSGKRAVQYLPLPLAADLHQQGVVGPATSPSGAAETDAGNTDQGGGLSLWQPEPAEAPEPEATEADYGGRPKVAVLQRKSSLGRLSTRLHRGRRRAQIIHSPSFRESGEVRGDEPLCSPVRTRPLSSLFG
ncbi:LOW QUALITY PROTEIN: hypothetical protein CRUP_037315 [Coryphaenoides rupestris]|nr:LOW QUALITY PROTEIN: hypothetical protein CRUP_037315 [Coryphaenoides rupestris]